MIRVVIDRDSGKKYFMSEIAYAKFQNFIKKQKKDFLIIEEGELKDKIKKRG